MYVAIEVEQLAKVYAGGTEALRDVSFHVQELQEAALDELLTGREFLTLVASLWGLGHRAARARADELLDLFDLAGAAGRRIGTYSGGMQRRLDLAAALVRRPEVLFLDEPTTGLDPQARRALWEEIRRLRGEGTTVFLTTQYLEEAETLADRLAVVHEGRIVALGTPETLRARLGGTVLRLRTTPEQAARAASRLAGRAKVLDGGTVEVEVDGAADALAAAAALAALGLRPDDIQIRRPSLEDVFLDLTGAASAAPGAAA
jgi:ABC-2 type transport system ATP-binding protein